MEKDLKKEVARKIAIDAFGTASGLKREKNIPDKTYSIDVGVLYAKMYYDNVHEGRYMVEIYIGAWPVYRLLYFCDSLKRDILGEYLLMAQLNNEIRKNWVSTHGTSYCHKAIDDIWNNL